MRVSFAGRIAAVVAAFLSVSPTVRQSAPLSAQIDYRNLDGERPARIEDAYPVERFALELLVPTAHVEREKGGPTVYAFVPELEYGLFANAQITLAAPVAGVEGTWGLSGLKLSALYNLNTETSLPAIAVRVDATIPVGGLAAEATGMTFKAIATRTLGRSRVHLNGAYTFGNDGTPAAAENPARWWAGAALDRTLPFRSTLLVAEVYALRSGNGAPTAVQASAGLRYQVTPSVVFDAGLGRGLRRGVGSEWSVTLGLSRALGLAGLIPSGQPSAVSRRQ